MKKHNNLISNKSGGFTMIELMVSISIITLLSTVVLASVVSARGNADKAAFVSSLHQFQVALETYKANNGFYPGEGDWVMSYSEQQSGNYNSSGGTLGVACAGGYTSSYGWYLPWFVNWENGDCTENLSSLLSNPIEITTPQPNPVWNWINQPALIPKYIKTAPVPPGKSGNMLAYLNVPLPFGINDLEINNASYNSPNPAYFCAGKKPQGYFIYFFDNENFEAGKPSNYPLPRITKNPTYSGGYSADPYGYEYCLTAS